MNNDRAADYSLEETVSLPESDSRDICTTFHCMDADAKVFSESEDDVGITNSIIASTFSEIDERISNNTSEFSSEETISLPESESPDIYTTFEDMDADAKIFSESGDDVGFTNSITHRVYIHIRNLPDAVCQAEVKSLFSKFDVPKGGISIYGSDAFVAFTNTHTAVDAYYRIEHTLRETAMWSSLIMTTEKVNEAIRQKVKRKLIFDFNSSFKETSNKSDQEKETESDDVISDEETPKVSAPVCGKKRIRPTTIPRGYRRIPFSSLNQPSVFDTEEIELPKRAFEHGLPRSGMNMEQPRCRKIRPNTEIWKESFEDLEGCVEYPEAKRIKLEPSSSGRNDKA